MKKVQREVKVSIVSVHESAHAVFTYLLGGYVCELVKKCDDVGHVYFNPPIDRVLEAAILMSGYEAEVLWFPTTLPEEPRHDWSRLRKLNVQYLGEELLRPSVVKLLKENKEIIFKVAETLDEKGKIGRINFIRIMKSNGYERVYI